jgi:hypothetical protein
MTCLIAEFSHIDLQSRDIEALQPGKSVLAQS